MTSVANSRLQSTFSLTFNVTKFFYHSSHFHYVRPQMVAILLYLVLLPHENARSRALLHFFHLPPYTLREKKHLNIAHYFCRRRESNPGCQRSKLVRYPFLHCLLANVTKFIQAYLIVIRSSPGCICRKLEVIIS